jgi:ATP-dependent DNA helicase RecG
MKGVGPKLAKTLSKHHIYTIGDLLLHCPFKYQDRTHITPISDLRAQDYVVIQAKVMSRNIQYGKKNRLNVKLADKTGSIQVTFFYYAHQLAQKWQVGSTWRILGQVAIYQNKLTLVHPESQLITDDYVPPLENNLTAIYPNIKGISQIVLRKLINQALEQFIDSNFIIEDIFYSKLQKKNILPLHKAIESIHKPSTETPVSLLNEKQGPGANRLIAEELYAHFLVLKSYREQASKCQAPELNVSKQDVKNFLKQFGFSLTNGQKSCVKDIIGDLKASTPMQRLVQGDVGSGKTLVGAIASLVALKSGYQVVFMAPTEILAQQIAANFRIWFEKENIRVALLTGKLKTSERKNVQENVLLGLDNLIVGTHALFQEKWKFKKLGLLIIDEQHRFGVSQRLSLQSQGAKSLKNALQPHQLVMTATPIPRTLAMSRYAHMDISTIDTMPEGRKPIQTFVISNQKKLQVIERIKEKIKQGEQIYWVCTLINESENLNCQAAEATYTELKSLLGGVSVGLVHGQMPPEQKTSVMDLFKSGEISVLVATTVIEVGVNVPNATLMVIENAERLGLSQLHQLRGRVGRASIQSHCILMYQAPLSETAKARLKIMRKTSDGFLIAEEDLKIRGPGEFLGLKQTGLAQYKIADVIRDQEWLQQMPQLHKKLFVLSEEQKQEIISRWIGNKEVYAKA